MDAPPFLWQVAAPEWQPLAACHTRRWGLPVRCWAKSSLLSNLKAVQEGNVYCTTKNLYQSSMELGTIISDLHKMMAGDDSSLTYLYRLE